MRKRIDFCSNIAKKKQPVLPFLEDSMSFLFVYTQVQDLCYFWSTLYKCQYHSYKKCRVHFVKKSLHISSSENYTVNFLYSAYGYIINKLLKSRILSVVCIWRFLTQPLGVVVSKHFSLVYDDTQRLCDKNSIVTFHVLLNELNTVQP